MCFRGPTESHRQHAGVTLELSRWPRAARCTLEGADPVQRWMSRIRTEAVPTISWRCARPRPPALGRCGMLIRAIGVGLPRLPYVIEHPRTLSDPRRFPTGRLAYERIFTVRTWRGCNTGSTRGQGAAGDGSPNPDPATRCLVETWEMAYFPLTCAACRHRVWLDVMEIGTKQIEVSPRSVPRCRCVPARDGPPAKKARKRGTDDDCPPEGTRTGA